MQHSIFAHESSQPTTGKVRNAETTICTLHMARAYAELRCWCRSNRVHCSQTKFNRPFSSYFGETYDVVVFAEIFNQDGEPVSRCPLAFSRACQCDG